MNRLGNEASLYLRQHAENPVDWWPWGTAALARARELDRPLFISSGYSSCHWCHVMEQESFVDRAVAALLNEHFLPIKIDREEHPEIDAQYMTALLLISGHGGWPMSVFALPDGRPFFAGTYFPRQARWGQPGFLDLLSRVAELWRSERDKLAADAERVSAGVRARSQIGAPVDLDPGGFATVLQRSLDRMLRDGGRHHAAPKFPPHEDVATWLHALAQGLAPAEAGAALRQTLDAMAWGGLRDQVGGAFHRYCVDAEWRVPHFEQMLYDNAQLLRAFADVVASGDDADDRRVLNELLGDWARRWRTPGGWLAAAWDADDPGGEGGYYTWTPAELRAALPADDAAWALSWFRVDTDGPVEGRSTLWPAAAPGRGHPQPADATRASLDRVLPALAAARATRPPPLRDDKGIVAHNGMALTALAAARRVLGARVEREWQSLADVLRSWAARLPLPRAVYAATSRGSGQLEDYAALARGLLDWGLAADQPDDVAAAHALAVAMLDRFQREGSWLAAVTDAPLGAPAGSWDAQTPSALSLAASLCGDLEILSGDHRFAAGADAAFATAAATMAQAPEATQAMWRAYDRLAHGVPHIVLVGAAAADWYQALAPQTPSTVLWVRPRVSRWMGERGWNAMAGRAHAEPRGYVCAGRSCRLPATSLAELTASLDAGDGATDDT